MLLTLEQIKRITFGAVNIWEEDGATYFAKCTPKQIRAWRNYGEHYSNRARETTPGIRFDFHTDSKHFAFTPKIPANYEIYIDNVLTYVFFKTEFVADMCREIFLDGEMHRITFYLPAHDAGILESVEIDDGATLTPHEFDCKILFIGDSITKGWDSSWDSLSFANHVARFYNADSITQGVGGTVFYADAFEETLDFDPDIVIVAYGTNDWAYFPTVEAGRKNCREFLDLICKRYKGKKIFGISPIWRGDTNVITKMGSFEECISYVKEEIAAHDDIVLIDGYTLTPHLPDFFADEFLHPDAKGFGIYALNLIAQMQKYL